MADPRQFILGLAHELVIDLFAGGGGASTGIEMAIGRHVDIAVNHDADAVGMHEMNHPQTKHYLCDVFEVDPLDATGGRAVGLLHAAKGMTRDEWADAWQFAWGSGASRSAVEAKLTFDSTPRGGIVGVVEVIDCVQHSESRWFVVDYGFVLANPKPLPFVPFKGSLGIFGVPVDALPAEYREAV